MLLTKLTFGEIVINTRHAMKLAWCMSQAPHHDWCAQDVWGLIGADWDEKLPTPIKVVSDEELNLGRVIKGTLVAALKETGYVQYRAARVLGISKRAIQYQCKKYNITHWSWRRTADECKKQG